MGKNEFQISDVGGRRESGHDSHKEWLRAQGVDL